MSTERLVVDEADRRRLRREAREARVRPAGRRSARPCRRSARWSASAAAERMDELIADAKAKGGVVRLRAESATARSSRRPSSTASRPQMRIYRRGIVRAGEAGRARQGRRGGGAGSPTTPNTASHRPSSAATSSGRWRSRGASKRASATSMGRRCTTRGRCRSAASRPPATASSAARR